MTAYLIYCNNSYYVLDKLSKKEILGIGEIFETLSALKEKEILIATSYALDFEMPEDMAQEELFDLIANYIVDMLNDGTIIVTAIKEYNFEGVADRGLGLVQHQQDVRRHYGMTM